MPDRKTPPALNPLPQASLIAPVERSLANGTRICIFKDNQQGVFKMDILFRTGREYASRPFIADTALNMLNEGTSSRTGREIAEIFDFHGAYMGLYTGFVQSSLSVVSLYKHAGTIAGLIAEMIAESRIPEEEMKIFLKNRKQELLLKLEKNNFIAHREFGKKLYGPSHPYANNTAPEDIERVNGKDVADFYASHIRSKAPTLLLSGRIEEDFLCRIEEIFGSFSYCTPAGGLPEFPEIPSTPGRYAVETKNSMQTSLRIGKKGLSITHPDYPGFIVLNTLIGGYFGSRLMSNIREEKGYTYGIHSVNIVLPQSAYWVIMSDVNSEYKDRAVEEVLKEIDILRKEPVGERELEMVKTYMHGEILRETDGIFAQSDTFAEKLAFGLDNRYFEGIIRNIHAQTPEMLLSIAQTHLNPEEFIIVTAG